MSSPERDAIRVLAFFGDSMSASFSSSHLVHLEEEIQTSKTLSQASLDQGDYAAQCDCDCDC